jgi:hypothetical protein
MSTWTPVAPAASSATSRWARPRRHAVELPVLAGIPLHRARPHGRQRRPAQARVQRAAVRAGHRGHRAPRRLHGGVFQTLLVGSRDVDRIIRDPRVRAVTLTGSEAAGAAVAGTAGASASRRPCSSSAAVTRSSSWQRRCREAPQTAVTARTINNGQSCIAAKRFIVADVYDAFERRFVAGMRRCVSATPSTTTPSSDPSPRSPSATSCTSRSLTPCARRARADRRTTRRAGRLVLSAHRAHRHRAGFASLQAMSCSGPVQRCSASAHRRSHPPGQ